MSSLRTTLHRWGDVFRRSDWRAVVCAVLVTAMLATLSVCRYTAYTARMFDLGHMTQAIWSSTHGRPLEFSYRGATISRLALHVELVYFLLTPLYALFPSPITLLLAQAILFGMGSLPLYRLAKRRIGNASAARLIVLIYLLYPVAQTAVLFDFHGDTLAMPLLLFAFDALDRRAWRAYGLWMAVALSCKVYIAAPVCVLGAFLWLKGLRREGSVTFLMGLTWGVITYLFVRSWFTVAGAEVEQSDVVGYAFFYYGDLINDLTNTWVGRLLVGLIVFIPVLPIGIYALDWVGLALVTALPALLSSGPGDSYNLMYHHYAVVVPFLMLAIVNAAERLRIARGDNRFSINAHRRTVTWRAALTAVALMTLLVNSLLVNTPLAPRFWFSGADGVWISSTYKRTSRDALKDRWLAANVPDEAPILATLTLAPHLANREVLNISRPQDGTQPVPVGELLDDVDCVVLDGLFDYIEIGDTGLVSYDWPTLTAALHRQEFGLISAQDGLLLLTRRPEGMNDVRWRELTLAQSVVVGAAAGQTSPRAVFGDAIGLVEASVTPMGDGRYIFRYAWLALGELDDSAPLFAVTQIVGVDDARILHVPTAVLHPTTEWAGGETITETFEAKLPDGLASGTHTLTVGWYDSSNPYAYQTDGRSRVGDSLEVLTLEIDLGSTSG